MDEKTIWRLIDIYFRENPQALVRHHIDSYNQFFTEDIFQLLLERKYKAAKAMMKTLGMKKVHIDKMIADSKKITTLH